MEASNKHHHQTLAPQHSNTQEVHALGLGNQALVVPLSHQFLDDSSCRDLVPNLKMHEVFHEFPDFRFKFKCGKSRLNLSELRLMPLAPTKVGACGKKVCSGRWKTAGQLWIKPAQCLK